MILDCLKRRLVGVNAPFHISSALPPQFCRQFYEQLSMKKATSDEMALGLYVKRWQQSGVVGLVEKQVNVIFCGETQARQLNLKTTT